MSSSIDFAGLPDLTNKHHAHAIALRCSDFRTRDRMTALLDNDYRFVDELVGLGGGYQLLREGYSERVIADIKTLSGLHDVKHLVIYNHLNCGALKAFCGATPDNELEINRDLFDKIREVIAEHLPDFTYDLVLVTPAVEAVDLRYAHAV